MAEFKLSYTASEINEKLSRIDSFAEASELPKKTSDLINDSDFTTKNYVQNYAQPIGDYALKSEVPTDYLTEIPEEYVTETELNEKGYLTNFIETDPTVPDWAKAATKPTYTASEVGALPADTVIPTVPTNVSAFTNDAGYLTEHQSLDGFATENYVNTQIAAIHIPDVSEQINAHNMNEYAHNDIRAAINELEQKINSSVTVSDDGNGNVVFETIPLSMKIVDDGEGNIIIS